MSNLVGYVKKVNTKDGKGKRGPWTLYSGILELNDGTESGWISFGFDKPPFSEGSYISIDVEKTDRGLQYVAGTGKVLDPPAKPVASLPAKSSEAATGGKSTYVDRNDSIVYQSSRKDALALVALLLEHDALPISASTAKVGQSKRFDEITAFVDKLTVQYVGDVQTGRVLQQVVDAGSEADPRPGNPGTGVVTDSEDND